MSRSPYRRTPSELFFLFLCDALLVVSMVAMLAVIVAVLARLLPACGG